MGVKNLLGELPAKSIRKGTIQDLKGMRLAIDGHCLLHRCCMFAAKQVLLENNLESTIDYLFNSVEKLLRHANSDSFLVFDGGCLLAKTTTVERRLDSRNENLRLAQQEIAAGRSGWDHLMKAFHVNDSQLVEIANALQTRFPRLTTLLSPCEADGQLAYLCATGLADAVFSLDADLLVYGVPALVSKFDAKTEELEIITQADIYKERLEGKNHHDLLRLALLAGCDYVPNLWQFGWARIWKFMPENGFSVFKCAVEAIETCKNVALPPGCSNSGEYARLIVTAAIAFTYHGIFDLWSGRCTNLHAVDPGDEELIALCGADVLPAAEGQNDAEEAIKIVTGSAHGDALLLKTRLAIKMKKLGERQDKLGFMSVRDLLCIQKINGTVISGEGFELDLAVDEKAKMDLK